MNILLKTAVVMAATIALVPSILHAASADYVVIQRSHSVLNDANNQVVLTFTLPNTVLTSGGTANSAALVLEVDGTEFNFNEMYVNPLGGVNAICDDDANDGNQPQSIGYVRGHDDTKAKGEHFTNVTTFSNSLLLSGGTNTLLICARDIDGDDIGNIDDFTVENIMLHYKNQ